MLLNIGLVILADFIGLLWVIGKIKKLPQKYMMLFHKLIWIGLGVSILSGAFLFWDVREYLLTVPAFYTKMFFVVALVINSFLISKHLRAALRVESFKSLSTKERKTFFISGAISTISWVMVLVTAQFLGL